MADKYVASMTARIVIPKDDIREQALLALKDAQKTVSGNEIRINITGNPEELNETLKKIQALNPTLRENITFQFDASELKKQLSQTDKYVGQEADQIGKTLSKYINKTFAQNLTVDDIIKEQLGNTAKVNPTNIKNIVNTLNQQIKSSKLTNDLNPLEIEAQAQAYKKLDIVLKSVNEGKYKNLKDSIPIKLPDMENNAEAMQTLFDKSGAIIKTNLSSWREELTKQYDTAFANITASMKQLTQVQPKAKTKAESIIVDTDNLDELTQKLKTAQKELDELKKDISQKASLDFLQKTAQKGNKVGDYLVTSSEEKTYKKWFDSYAIENGVDSLPKDVKDFYKQLKSVEGDLAPLEKLEKKRQQYKDLQLTIEQLTTASERLAQQSTKTNQAVDTVVQTTGSVPLTSQSSSAEQSIVESSTTPAVEGVSIEQYKAVNQELETTQANLKKIEVMWNQSNATVGELQAKLKNIKPDTNKDEVSNLKTQLKSITSQMEIFEQASVDAEEQVSHLKEKLNSFGRGVVSEEMYQNTYDYTLTLNKELQELREQFKATSDNLATMTKELQQTQGENAQLKTEVQEANEKVANAPDPELMASYLKTLTEQKAAIEVNNAKIKEQDALVTDLVAKYEAMAAVLAQVKESTNTIKQFSLTSNEIFNVATDSLNKEYKDIDDTRLKDKAATYYANYVNLQKKNKQPIEPLKMGEVDVSDEMLKRYKELYQLNLQAQKMAAQNKTEIDTLGSLRQYSIELEKKVLIVRAHIQELEQESKDLVQIEKDLAKTTDAAVQSTEKAKTKSKDSNKANKAVETADATQSTMMSKEELKDKLIQTQDKKKLVSQVQNAVPSGEVILKPVLSPTFKQDAQTALNTVELEKGVILTVNADVANINAQIQAHKAEILPIDVDVVPVPTVANQAPITPQTSDSSVVNQESEAFEKIKLSVNSLKESIEVKTQAIVEEELQLRSSASKEVKSIASIKKKVEDTAKSIKDVPTIKLTYKTDTKSLESTANKLLVVAESARRAGKQIAYFNDEQTKKKTLESKSISLDKEKAALKIAQERVDAEKAKTDAIKAKTTATKAQAKVTIEAAKEELAVIKEKAKANKAVSTEKLSAVQEKADARVRKAQQSAEKSFGLYQPSAAVEKQTRDLATFIATNSAMQLDPSELINPDKFAEAQSAVKDIYTKLSESSKITKKEIDELTISLIKQKDILTKESGKDNLLNQSSDINKVVKSLEKYIQTSTAINTNPANLLDTTEFDKSRNNIIDIYNQLSSGSKKTKAEIDKLVVSLAQQKQILQDSVGKSNQVFQSESSVEQSKFALEKFIQTNPKMQIDPTTLINSNKFDAAKQAIQSIYDKLNSEVKLTKEEVQSLNIELTKQKQIISTETGNNNLLIQSNGSEYIGTADKIGNLTDNVERLALQQAEGIKVFGKWNATQDQYTYGIRTKENAIKTYVASVNNATGAVWTLEKAETAYVSQGQKVINSVVKKMTEVSKYLISMGSIYSLINFFRQGFTVVQKFDSAMTELKKVSNDSTAALDAFSKSAYKTATTIGTTGTELINSTADWERLGKSIKDATALAVDTGVLLNVSEFESIADATEAMIAMTSAFDITAENADLLVDKLNEVGNEFAIATDGIAEGLEDSASALVSAGVSIDGSIALMTAGNQTIQDVLEVGKGLRTIALRLRGTNVKTLTDMGEDTEGLIVTTSKLEAKIKSLTAVNGKMGISIYDANGNYRDTYSILLDISKIWNEIGKADIKDGINRQAGLLETMAGKNRSNILASILQNPEILEDAYNSSMESAGSAQEELSVYMESIEGHLELLTNAWEGLWNDTVSRNFINFFIDLGTSLLDTSKNLGMLKVGLVALVGVASLIKNKGIFTAQNGQLGIADGIVGMFTKSTQAATVFQHQLSVDTKALIQYENTTNKAALTQDELTDMFQGTSVQARNWRAEIKNGSKTTAEFAAEQTLMAKEMQVATTSMVAQQMVMKVAAVALNMAVGLLVSVAVSGIIKAIDDNFESASEKVERFEAAISSLEETISSLDESQNTVEELISSYEELDNKLKLSTNTDADVYSIKTDLLELQNQLITSYGNQANGIDLVNGKYDEEIAKIKELTAEQQKQWLNENLGNYSSAKEKQTETDSYNILDTDPYESFTKSDAFSTWFKDFSTKFKLTNSFDSGSLGRRYDTGQLNEEQAYQLYEDMLSYAEDNPLEDKLYDELKTNLEAFFSEHNMTDIEKVNAVVQEYEKKAALSGDQSNLYTALNDALNLYVADINSGKDANIAQKGFNDIWTDYLQLDKTKVDDTVEKAFEYIYKLFTEQGSNYEANAYKTFFQQKETGLYSQTVKDLRAKKLTDVDLNVSSGEFSTKNESAQNSLNWLLDDSKSRGFNLTAQQMKDVLIDLGIVAKEVTEDTKGVFAVSTYSTQIDGYQSSVDSLAKAFQTLSNGEDLAPNDLIDLFQQFPSLIDKTDNLSVAIKELAIKSLEDLFNTFSEEVPDSLKTSLQEYIDKAFETSSAFSNLSDAISKLTSNAQLVTQAQNDVRDLGKIQLSTIGSIATTYPDLTSLLAEYVAGLASEQDVLNGLGDAYKEDEGKYKTCILNKVEANKEFYSNLLVTEGTQIAALATSYDLDYKNWTTVLQAKQTAYNAFVTDLENKWNDYYDVVYDENSGLYSIESKGTELKTDKDIQNYMRAYTSALTSTKKLNDFNSSLNKLADINLNFDTSIETMSSSGDNKFDWAALSVQQLQDAISALDAQLSNATSSQKRLNIINQLISANKALTSGLQQSKVAYQSEWDKAKGKLTGSNSGYVDKIQSGETFSVEDFQGKDDLYKLVTEAQDAYKQLTDINNDIVEQNYESANLVQQAYDETLKDYSNRLSSLSNQQKDIENKISSIESLGGDVPTRLYEQQIAKSKEVAKTYQSELVYLQKQLSLTEKGTDNYYAIDAAIQNCEDSLTQCSQSQEEWTNAIRDAQLKPYNKIHESLDNLQSEISDIISLFGDVKMFKDGTANFTDEAIANMGLFAQQLTTSQKSMSTYEQQISKLYEMYKQGLYTESEYNDLLTETQANYRAAALSAQEAKDAIIDYNKQALEKEISLKREYIDAEEEALDKAEALHDYEKSIADQSKNVSTLKRQIAALEGSTDREDIAQRLALTAELTDAQSALTEDQRDHDVEVKKQGWEDEYKSFEDTKNKEIDDLTYNLDTQEAVIADSLATIKSNYATIYGEITNVTAPYSITLTTQLTSPWTSATQAALLYKQVISGISSVKVPSTSSISSVLEKTGVTTGTAGTALNKFLISEGYSKLSWAEMAQLGQDLNIKGATTASVQSSGSIRMQILTALKAALANASFTDGGYPTFSNLVSDTGEDGIALVKRGEPILTQEQGALFKELVSNLQPLNTVVKALNFDMMKNLPSFAGNQAIGLTISSPLISITGITSDEINAQTQKMISKIPEDIMKAMLQYGVKR